MYYPAGLWPFVVSAISDTLGPEGRRKVIAPHHEPHDPQPSTESTTQVCISAFEKRSRKNAKRLATRTQGTP